MKNFLMSTADTAVATLSDLADTFAGLLQKIIGPVLIVLGSAAALYAIYLGVMYAKAEDANKRKEVQGRLIGAAIGIVIILLGIVLIYSLDWKNIISTWQGNPGGTSTPTT